MLFIHLQIEEQLRRVHQGAGGLGKACTVNGYDRLVVQSMAMTGWQEIVKDRLVGIVQKMGVQKGAKT